MKKILAVLFVLIAGVVSAQETYTITIPAGRVVQFTVILIDQNLNGVCAPLSILPGACTQAAVCAAADPVISPCNASNARAANKRIYPTTQAGREEWFQFVYAPLGLPDITTKAENAVKAVRALNLKNDTQAARDADCIANGLPAGCPQ